LAESTGTERYNAVKARTTREYLVKGGVIKREFQTLCGIREGLGTVP